ncbi:MAG: hypothetical protein M1825_006018 [Sarcosagium campestre]|nr:MAG: hypothetical protein M1825_006018 [Sarcosagium campestre]
MPARKNLASVSPAYTKPVGNEPKGNPIGNPGLNEQVPVEEPYTISWDPTSDGTVTLILLRGPSTNIKPLKVLVERLPNQGSYIWNPSNSLEPDKTHYGIQLIDDNSGAYQYTAQFGIVNDAYERSSVSAKPDDINAKTDLDPARSKSTKSPVIGESVTYHHDAIAVSGSHSSKLYSYPNITLNGFLGPTAASTGFVPPVDPTNSFDIGPKARSSSVQQAPAPTQSTNFATRTAVCAQSFMYLAVYLGVIVSY